MSRGRQAQAVKLSREDRRSLELLTRRGTAEHRHVMRAQIALLCHAGTSTTAISEAVGVSVQTVSHWRTRLARQGLKGLDEVARPGHPRRIGPSAIRRRVRRRTVPSTRPRPAVWVHTPRLQLKAQGINDSWNTLRQTLATQRRVTVTLQRRDGRVVHVRKATRPKPRHQTLGTLLKLDPNPGRTYRVLV